MLKRLVSDFLLSDIACAFAILDYMRDTKAYPLTITVASVLHELEYLGFSEVQDDAIDGSCASVAAAKTLAARKQAYDTTPESLSGEDSIGDYEEFFVPGIRYTLSNRFHRHSPV